MPIGPELVAALRAWRRDCPLAADLVFPGADGKMRPRERAPRGFANLAEAVRVPGKNAITFHDLRHTAASLMVMAGLNLRTVQKMLGHSVITVTERYAHLGDDYIASDRQSLPEADASARGLRLGCQRIGSAAPGGPLTGLPEASAWRACGDAPFCIQGRKRSAGQLMRPSRTVRSSLSRSPSWKTSSTPPRLVFASVRGGRLQLAPRSSR